MAAVKHIRRKCRAVAGETLVETLAALLVATLAIALLFSSAAVAHRLTSQATMAEDDMLTQRSAAEQKTLSQGEGTCKLTSPTGISTSVNVNFFGTDETGVMAYGRIE